MDEVKNSENTEGRPFQLEISVYDPAGTIRREERWATAPGETPMEDTLNIWICEPYIVGEITASTRVAHRWRCIAARQEIWLGQLVAHGGAGGWQVIGAALGTPAAEALARHLATSTPPAATLNDLSAAVLAQVRAALRGGRYFAAVQAVWQELGCARVQARALVDELNEQMIRDDRTIGTASAALDTTSQENT